MAGRRQRPGDEDDSNPLHDATWLYSYADLMTQLLIFAILIVSVLGAPKPPEPKAEARAEAKASELERTADAVQQLVRHAGLEQQVAVDRSVDRLVIRMRSAILFDEGRAALTGAAREVLAGLAPLLARTPSPLRVEGHTDDVPVRSAAFPSNWELSTARAIAVTQYLEERGVAPGRLSVAGYAEFHPFVPNDGAEHRALNRRVEIVVLGG